MKRKPIALIILDGYAIGKEYAGNAISNAKTTNIDKLLKQYPHSQLNASGMFVGLPHGQMGNSEVGHLNIGAGRVVYQSLTRINHAIETNELSNNINIIEAINNAKNNDKKLHIFGLLSDGGVHSHINHITSLIKTAKENNVEQVYIHAFLDGRDVPPKSALKYISQLKEEMHLIGVGKIATISGRYYAMDRDSNWDRTQKAYDAISFAKGTKFPSASSGIKSSYDEDILDEFIEPFIVDSDGVVSNGDSIIFANFRPDRAIQIATAFSNPSKASFDTKNGPSNLNFYSMMHYSSEVLGKVIFEKQELKNMLGDVICSNGLSQLRIAETEKYAHVTFFLDGGIDKEIENSKRILINSPKVATYDLLPEMSANEVTDAVIKEIEKSKFDLIILNYANCDMVGHTTNINATTKAVEIVDNCLIKVVEKITEVGGISIITSDHGNAEVMLDEQGKPYSAHTTNPVPIIITNNEIKIRDGGKLADIAPTILELLEVEKPEEMTGESLIQTK